MAGNDRSGEQIDADILRCKADILRARDIIPGASKQNPPLLEPNKGRLGSFPPYKKKSHQEPKSQKIGENAARSADAPEISAEKEKQAREAPCPIPIETIPPEEAVPASAAGGRINHKETVKMSQKQPEIPKFDLAEEIMAEQRKITAIRRKAPGKKAEAQSREPYVESVSYAVEQPTPARLEQNRIIAEIVAKDIERLYRGDTSDIRGQDFKDTNRDTK